jgi:calmodulin
MTTRDLLKEGDRWGGHEVLAVTDPTGTLSLDDPLMLEVHPHKGVTVLSHGARGEQLLSWPFSAVATVEGALQSEDPDDMQLLLVKVKGNETFEFEMDDAMAFAMLYDEALRELRGDVAEAIDDGEVVEELSIGVKVANEVKVVVHFFDEGELDRFWAALRLARAALGFSHSCSDKTAAIATAPETVSRGDLQFAMRCFGMDSHVDSIFGAFSRFGGPTVQFHAMQEFVGTLQIGFEEHMQANGFATGPCSARVMKMDMMRMRKTFDAIATSGSGGFSDLELSDALRKLGIAFTDDGVAAGVRKLKRHRSKEKRGPGISWLEFVEGVADLTFEGGTTFGKELLAVQTNLAFPVFHAFPLEFPPSLKLPEEVAFVFHDGLGGLKIAPAEAPHGSALMTVMMAQIREFSVASQSDDPDDCDVLTMRTREGLALIFEVEDGDGLRAAQKQAVRDCTRIATARSGGANLLAPLQHAMLKGVFDVFDVNGDGDVTANELRLIFNVIGTDLNWEEMFTKLDIDGDGKVTLQELTHVVSFETAMSGSSGFLKVLQYDVIKVKEAFDVVDVDGSGTISSSELKTVMGVLGHSLDDEKLAVAMSVLDADQSGSVDWTEFLHAIANKDLEDCGIGRAFRTETIAQLSGARDSLETSLAMHKAQLLRETRNRQKLETQLKMLEKQLGVEKQLRFSQRDLFDEAANMLAKEKAGRMEATKRAQKGRATREATLAMLAKQVSAIDGWKVQISCMGLKAKGVVEKSAKKPFSAASFVIRFDEPYPDQFPSGKGKICLDRKDPKCGTRVLRPAQDGKEACFVYMLYPFQLVGSGPADDVRSNFKSGGKLTKRGVLAGAYTDRRSTEIVIGAL